MLGFHSVSEYAVSEIPLNPISATLGKTLAALTSTSAAGLAINATASKTLAALTSSSAGNISGSGLEGALAKTLAALTSTSAAQINIGGNAAILLAMLTSASSTKLDINGAGFTTLAALTADADGYYVSNIVFAPRRSRYSNMQISRRRNLQCH